VGDFDPATGGGFSIGQRGMHHACAACARTDGRQKVSCPGKHLRPPLAGRAANLTLHEILLYQIVVPTGKEIINRKDSGNSPSRLDTLFPQ